MAQGLNARPGAENRAGIRGYHEGGEAPRKPLLTGWSLVRIRPGEPALSRTYAQYFEFFVLKPRELDTPSFKPLIAFGVSLGRNAAQAFFSQAYSPQLSNLRWLCAACACDSCGRRDE